MTPNLRRILLPLAALGCYIVSFFLPALWLTGQANTDGRETNMVGVMAFINGFFALFNVQVAWLANPLAGVALILLLCRVHLMSLAFSHSALLGELSSIPVRRAARAGADRATFGCQRIGGAENFIGGFPGISQRVATRVARAATFARNTGG